MESHYLFSCRDKNHRRHIPHCEELQDLAVQMVTRVIVVSQEHREPKDHRDTQVPQGTQALEVTLVNLELKVQKALLAVVLAD